MNAAPAGAPLREPAFRRLWLGLSISYLGDPFTFIVLIWFVLQLTGSGAAVAGPLLQHVAAPLVIAICGGACILAGLGGLLSRSLRGLRGRISSVYWRVVPG